MRTCEADGCGKPTKAARLCPMHYARMQRHGTLDGLYQQGDPFDRLMRRVEQTKDGCWLWRGKGTKNGYAAVGHDNRSLYGHRLVYERLVGPIPPGVRLHHECEQPRCVNPAHLHPVTASEHSRAHGLGVGPCRLCGANDWYIRGDTGQRQCRECRRRRRKAEAAVRPPRTEPPRNFQREKTHCVHGHEYTPENTVRRDGHRRCRECHRIEASRRYYASK